MALVILAYDQFLFRPIVAWATSSGSSRPRPSSAEVLGLHDLVRRTKLLRRIVSTLASAFARVPALRILSPQQRPRPFLAVLARAARLVWLAVVLMATAPRCG
jgi:NitT/TauT family transport system permease protein